MSTLNNDVDDILNNIIDIIVDTNLKEQHNTDSGLFVFTPSKKDVVNTNQHNNTGLYVPPKSNNTGLYVPPKSNNTGLYVPPKKKNINKNNKNSHDGRPTFYLDDNFNKPIRAGGIIHYKYVDNVMYLLLSYCNNKFEDLGGKTDKQDINIYETISREVNEESNSKFNKFSTLSIIKKSNACAYITDAKYLVYLVQASNRDAQYDVEDFGSIEKHTKCQRTIMWISAEKFLNDKFKQHLHTRIRNAQVYDLIKNIIDV